jgi:2-polyprenyl-3-methyl-5-hydroxy-6-metoxy-1,4-benzoquinol methylase|tara:strand:+ start:11100 stop:11876 length:777 start_codon:yes stop_codon:yes gene_type:complete
MQDPGRTIDKTHLSIDQAEERGFIHRDYLAHCFRWSHVVKHLGKKKLYKKAKIVDIGCGKEIPLLKTLYTMKMTPKEYMAIDANKIELKDIHKKIKEKMGEESFLLEDETDFSNAYYDKVDPHVITCFEVLEHNTLPKVVKILANVHKMANKDTTIFISTPVFNGKAAANHINEMTYETMEGLLTTGEFDIINRYGTFASQTEIEPVLYETGPNELTKAYEYLKEYYDSNILSCFLAPLFPRNSRNVLWEVKICGNQT